MERHQILQEVNEIFIDVVDNNQIILNENSSANDFEEWDSINNIQLVVAIEKHFKIRFSSKEIQSWKIVGDMLSAIESKLS